jgi:hypothetical protein
MSKHIWFVVFAACCLLLVTGTAQADTVRVTGAFTSFTGIVTNQNLMDWCGADQCGSIGLPSPPVTLCPDTGCSTSVGLLSNFPISMSPSQDTTSSVTFSVPFNPPSNELIFKAATGTNGFPLSVDNPTSPFKLGTLTFTNGLWTGNADFGFSIVVQDSTTQTSHVFTGFVHMGLTSPNTGTPAQNADFIYLTDAAGNAVVNPLTGVALPSLRAYELADSPTGSNTVSADIYGKFGSLDPTSFQNVTGGGFLDASLTPALTTPPVPEPGTLMLLVTGLLPIAGTLKKSLLTRVSRQG